MIRRVAVIGKKFENEATETEKWYGTKYKLEKLPEDLIKVSSVNLLFEYFPLNWLSFT